MLKQIDFLWNQEDKDSRMVEVGGQGEEGSEKEGREEEGREEEGMGKKSLIRTVTSRAVRSMLERIRTGRRRVCVRNLNNNNLFLYDKMGDFSALSISTW